MTIKHYTYEKTNTHLIILISVGLSAQVTTLDWVQSFGEHYEDKAKSVAVDDSGNVYTIGHFKGTVDFNPSGQAHNLTSEYNGSIPIQSGYVLKLDKMGQFVWVKKFNTAYNPYITIDSSDNIVICGTLVGTLDMDPGPGMHAVSHSGNHHSLFLTKWDLNGQFIWAGVIGGGIITIDEVALTVDKNNNIFISSTFRDSIDADPGTGTFNLIGTNSIGNGGNAFICKIDASNQLVWAKSFNANRDCRAKSITTDGLGNVISVGEFFGNVDFDPGSSIYPLISYKLYQDVYISKLDINGDFVWTKAIHGYWFDHVSSVETDVNDNIIISGVFEDTLDFDPSPGKHELISKGDKDIYHAKYDSNGDLLWVNSIGTTDEERLSKAIVNKSGELYTCGAFTGDLDFDPGAGQTKLSAINRYDIFISKYDDQGNHLWAIQFEGTQDEGDESMVLDGDNIYISGYYWDYVDFDPNSSTIIKTAVGKQDAFVCKLKDLSVGIDDPTLLSKSFQLFPNPASSNFTIKLDEMESAKLNITDVAGRQVYSRENVESNNGEIKVSDLNLKPGIYFVEVSGGKNRLTSKLLIN